MLTAVAWLVVLLLLLLAMLRSPAPWVVLPAVVAGHAMRSEAVLRWVDQSDLRERTELKLAAVLGLMACSSALAASWIAHPPAGAAPGLAGLWSELRLPYLGGASVVLAMMVLAHRRAEDTATKPSASARATGDQPVQFAGLATSAGLDEPGPDWGPHLAS